MSEKLDSSSCTVIRKHSDALIRAGELRKILKQRTGYDLVLLNEPLHYVSFTAFGKTDRLPLEVIHSVTLSFAGLSSQPGARTQEVRHSVLQRLGFLRNFLLKKLKM